MVGLLADQKGLSREGAMEKLVSEAPESILLPLGSVLGLLSEKVFMSITKFSGAYMLRLLRVGKACSLQPAALQHPGSMTAL